LVYFLGDTSNSVKTNENGAFNITTSKKSLSLIARPGSYILSENNESNGSIESNRKLDPSLSKEATLIVMGHQDNSFFGIKLENIAVDGQPLLKLFSNPTPVEILELVFSLPSYNISIL